MTLPITRQWVHFASQLTVDDLPETLQHKIRLHLLDSIGCGWASSTQSISVPFLQVARVSGGEGRCSVFGHQGFSPLAAVFANASVINALDHDDGVEIHGKGLGHPGASLVASALTTLDLCDKPVSAARLITALVAGYELNNRLIYAIQPTAGRFHQVYGVAQHQSIGSALVAGLLLEFSPQQLNDALGLAAALTPLPSMHQYNWQQRPLMSLKDAVAPAAQAGLQAVLMVQQGLRGSQNVLDGERGFWRMMGSDQVSQTVMTAGLGNEWYAGFGSFKRYPACRWLACALECMQHIIQTSGWKPEDIQAVRVHSFPRLVNDLMDCRPQTATDAQFSLPWTLAMVAADIPPGADWYSEQTLKNSHYQTFAGKVSAVIDKEFTARMEGSARQPGARVEVIHRHGETRSHQQFIPSGSAEYPLSEAQIVEKAQHNLRTAARDSGELISRIMQQPAGLNYHSAAGLTGASNLLAGQVRTVENH